MLLLLIIACEICFWVFLLLGFAARYLFRWRRLSATLLLCVSLIDLVLFIKSVLAAVFLWQRGKVIWR